MRRAWTRWVPEKLKAWIRVRRLRSDSKEKPSRVIFDGRRYRNQRANRSLARGCNLFGYARAESGLGEHVRLVGGSLQRAGIPFCVLDCETTVHREEERLLEPFLAREAAYRTNLICYNGNLISRWSRERNPLTEGRYNIGYGYWELSEYPDPWLYSMNLLDEIWAPSRFIQEVISRKTTVPVLHMPGAVAWEIGKAYRREDFDLPADAFLFLYVFDFVAFHRKNPMDLVRAFREAFPPKIREVRLVLKTKAVEAVEAKEEWEQLQEAFGQDDRIILMDRYLSKEEVLGLLSVCDSYISLHRSEGFGLTLAEAMALKKPTIATAYSGNLEFMTAENSCLVDYELIPVQRGQYFGLEEGSMWAQPDLSQAVEAMRSVFQRPGETAKMAERGRKSILERFSFEDAGRRYRERLELLDLL